LEGLNVFERVFKEAIQPYQFGTSLKFKKSNAQVLHWAAMLPAELSFVSHWYVSYSSQCAELRESKRQAVIKRP